jgi:hypothetical protein
VACEPGLRLRRSPGLGDFVPVTPERRQRPSHRGSKTSDSLLETVARARTFRLTVARRRRLFTVFPCTESRVIVDGEPNFLARRLLLRSTNSQVAQAEILTFRTPLLFHRGEESAVAFVLHQSLLTDSTGCPAKSRAASRWLSTRPPTALRTLPRAARYRRLPRAFPRAGTFPCEAARRGRKTPRRD